MTGALAPGRRLVALGAACLAVALAASSALALRHLGAALPGCGLDSPCERALHGPLAELPFASWPLAFLGTSAFAALLLAWLVARAGWPRSLAWVARAGGLASLALLVLALAGGTPCPFCLAAQLANLGFVACSERARGPARSPRAEAAFALAALLSTALLAAPFVRERHAREAAFERDLANARAGSPAARPFTARYRLGPERAVVRIVLFGGYQCSHCAQLEEEARALVAEHGDVSLSPKHFPLCTDCNRLARERGLNPHPNACWAARAAEAAGLEGGAEAFWRVHAWLFARGGSFTDADLGVALPGLGLEPQPFLAALNGPETLARVTADVEEALALGLQNTPIVFLNGVELRGASDPQGLRRAVEELLATAPPARGPEDDHPADALSKCLQDWRLGQEVSLPEGDVVVWGDYQDAGTRELDRRVRAFAAGEPGLRYAFHHYPVDPECAPNAPRMHPGSCAAARTAEAVRALGGDAAFERVHARLMDMDLPLGAAALAQAARDAGLDPDRVAAAARGPEAEAAVQRDLAAARALRIVSIPLVYVGGKPVPRWKLEGTDLLERILREALASRGAGAR